MTWFVSAAGQLHPWLIFWHLTITNHHVTITKSPHHVTMSHHVTPCHHNHVNTKRSKIYDVLKIAAAHWDQKYILKVCRFCCFSLFLSFCVKIKLFSRRLPPTPRKPSTLACQVPNPKFTYQQCRLGQVFTILRYLRY